MDIVVVLCFQHVNCIFQIKILQFRSITEKVCCKAQDKCEQHLRLSLKLSIHTLQEVNFV